MFFVQLSSFLLMGCLSDFVPSSIILLQYFMILILSIFLSIYYINLAWLVSFLLLFQLLLFMNRINFHQFISQGILCLVTKNKYQYLFIYIIMLKLWIYTYVILLCCNPATFYVENLMVFQRTFNNKRVYLEESPFSTKLKIIHLVQAQVIGSNYDKKENIQNCNYKILGNSTIVEQILDFSAQFRALKFSLQPYQLKMLAEKVKNLYQKDKISIFFIAAYFIKACQLLQLQKMPAVQINRVITKKIKFLMNLTSIETYRKQHFGISQNSSLSNNYWKDVQDEIVPMVPKKFILNSLQKDKQIQDIIMIMYQEAKSKFQIFSAIILNSFEKNNGYSPHINYKIRDRKQASQMKRIKEKLLRKYLDDYASKRLNRFSDIESKRKIEETRFQTELNQIYIGLTEIQFIVKDILRAKCMFNSVTDIHSAALSILGNVRNLQKQGMDIKMIQFENRLDKITCDIVLVVQIGQLGYQIQLALSFDQNMFEISHKMYEMTRSKVFSPIVQLFSWFQKIAPQFFYSLGYKLMNYSRLTNTSIDNQLVAQYQFLKQLFSIDSQFDYLKDSKVQFEKQVQNQIEFQNREIIKQFQSLTLQTQQQFN